MAVYGVSGVKLDARGRVERVQLGLIDLKNNTWVEAPKKCEMQEVISLIAAGYDVFSIFIVGRNMVQGPKFKVVEYDHGIPGIELEKQAAGMSLRDMAMS
jgi:hypothetical protein